MKAFKVRTLSQSLRFRWILLMFCQVMLGSCDQNPKEVDVEAVRSEVTTRLESFAAAINSGDTEAMIDFYSKNDRFYWVEDGQITYPNSEAVTGALSGLFTTIETADMRVLDTKVTVLSNDRANIYSEYEQDMKMKSGFAFSINGAMTVLMEKEDDGIWRYVIGHSSTKKER